MSSLQDRTRFEPAEVEPRIIERWLQSHLHHPEPDGTAAENYSIAIPPPNVTGALHMGHALNGSIQDCLIRYHRMRGQRTKWILGTDHAGIATQKQVEKPARVRGHEPRRARPRARSSSASGSGAKQYGGTIIEQFKRLGASADYDDERFTLDEGYVQAVLKVFVDLYDKGLIYRDHYMVNWDPGSRSAISDLEVEDREVTDTLYSHRLPARGRRRDRGRHRAPRDDARRHRRRRAPRRRALPRPRRAHGHAAARRPPTCRSSPTTTSRPTSAPAR